MSSLKPSPKKPSSMPAETFTICGSVASPSGSTGFELFERRTLRQILPTSRPKARGSPRFMLATARSIPSFTSAPLATMRPVTYCRLPRCSSARPKASAASLLHSVMKPSARRAAPSKLRLSSPTPARPEVKNSSRTSTKFWAVWVAPPRTLPTLFMRHSASGRESLSTWSTPSAMPSTICTPLVERPLLAPSSSADSKPPASSSAWVGRVALRSAWSASLATAAAFCSACRSVPTLASA
mmetsp:Transcript_16312/g.51124  ORF Transcript_16312/g.51124 Transcript_16312/m.51124 type:complete len:240 (+) Transcript_16312:945-1664(+)